MWKVEKSACSIWFLVLFRKARRAEQSELSHDRGLQLWTRDVAVGETTFAWRLFLYLGTVVRVAPRLLFLRLRLLLQPLLLPHHTSRHITRKHTASRPPSEIRIDFFFDFFSDLLLLLRSAALQPVVGVMCFDLVGCGSAPKCLSMIPCAVLRFCHPVDLGGGAERVKSPT